MRVRGALGCVLAAVVLVAGGCTRPPDSAGTLLRPALGTGPITFVDGKDTSRGAQIKSLVESWNRGPRGERERVTFVELPASTDEHRAQLLARAQDMAAANTGEAEAGQCYDVVMLDLIWTAEFAQAGHLRPLDPDEFELDEFLGKPVEGAMFAGQQWAVPSRGDAGLLFYRKDVLDAEGESPPKSWEELAHQANTIAPRHDLNGYVGQFTRYEGFTVNALEAIWARGGDVLADDGSEVVIDSPEAKAGIDLLMDGFSDGWIPADALNYNEERSREAFQRGDALFMRNWPYAHRLLNASESPVSGKFDVTTMPWPTALGGWNVAVSQCSANLRTAYDFIKELTSEANQQELFKHAGFAPTRAAVYEDGELRRNFPYLAVLQDAMTHARNRPVTPYYNQLSRLIQEYLQPAVDNNGSLDPVMDDLADALEAAQDGR